MTGKSIFDKLWDRHVITGEEGSPTHVCGSALYSRSDQSSGSSRITRRGRRLRRSDLTFGTFDHNVPTVNICDIRDVISKAQIDKLG